MRSSESPDEDALSESIKVGRDVAQKASAVELPRQCLSAIVTPLIRGVAAVPLHVLKSKKDCYEISLACVFYGAGLGSVIRDFRLGAIGLR